MLVYSACGNILKIKKLEDQTDIVQFHVHSKKLFIAMPDMLLGLFNSHVAVICWSSLTSLLVCSGQ